MTVHVQTPKSSANGKSPWAQAPDLPPARTTVPEDLPIHDPTVTIRYYNALARKFGQAAEAAHESTLTAMSREALQAGDAGNEINDSLMDFAYLLADGLDLPDVVAKVLGRAREFNRAGVEMAAPDLLQPAQDEPALVLSKSKAAEKYMEYAACKRFLRLVDIYDASLMIKREDYPAAQSYQAEMYYNPRKDVLDEVRRTLTRDIKWLAAHDPDVRPLTKQDYTPL
ncbi:MAG: hypothetical protein KKA05_00430 [Alphaproteobacteria bacterium]|nr:hypothetical protein [Alphaproteobacteria bacterium]MBU0859501.1 hypothetical protein [Alphaproteobacteria bacterium]